MSHCVVSAWPEPGFVGTPDYLGGHPWASRAAHPCAARRTEETAHGTQLAGPHPSGAGGRALIRRASRSSSIAVILN